MKRIFAFILFLVFMTFKLLTWVPSAAATGIPAFDAFYYAILQTLGMAYTNGVELDLAPAIAEVRENIPDYLQQPDVALKYLLRDYAGKAWDYLAFNWENSSTFEDVGLAETAAIGLANSSGISIPTLQDIVKQWSNKALDLDKDITTPIDSNAVAFWNKFSNIEINNYLEKINTIEGDPDIIDVPTDITTLATNYIRWSPLPIVYPPTAEGDYNPALWNQYSYIFNSDPAVIVPGYTGYVQVNLYTKFNYLITQVNDNSGRYLVSHSDTTRLKFNQYNYNAQYSYGTYNNNQGYLFAAWNSNTHNPITNQYYNSYEAALNAILTRSRGCNVYLGDSFSNATPIIVGGTYIQQFNASVPNAVIDTGTDNGKIVSNPIYWVVDNNTGTPIDSQINLDKLIDYLKGIIDGTNDDTTTSFGDLVDAGVIEKQDGTAITDADVIAVPVADVIDDALARADPISIPIVITGTLPPLPPLPPFFPTPDFPEGDPTSGFNGMSVLARIINITNQSLPDELVITFYGVIFGAIVLGLIKILHK